MEADAHPKVTENMEIIKIVKTLVEKGFAYEARGDVYFRTARFSEYGKLSHMPLEELEAGARIEVNSVKEDPMDFALWKASNPVNLVGNPHGVKGGRDGISSVRLWLKSFLGKPSISIVAAKI